MPVMRSWRGTALGLINRVINCIIHPIIQSAKLILFWLFPNLFSKNTVIIHPSFPAAKRALEALMAVSITLRRFLRGILRNLLLGQEVCRPL